jgi:uncharacterized protein (DUF2236 family)
MNGLKKIEYFVNEQLEYFFEDFEDSKKNIKLFPSFSKISTQYEMTEIKIPQPKKKFQPKVRAMNKNSDKGIF